MADLFILQWQQAENPIAELWCLEFMAISVGTVMEVDDGWSGQLFYDRATDSLHATRNEAMIRVADKVKRYMALASKHPVREIQPDEDPTWTVPEMLDQLDAELDDDPAEYFDSQSKGE